MPVLTGRSLGEKKHSRMMMNWEIMWPKQKVVWKRGHHRGVSLPLKSEEARAPREAGDAQSSERRDAQRRGGRDRWRGGVGGGDGSLESGRGTAREEDSQGRGESGE